MRPVRVAIVLAAIVSLPALGAGFFCDDYSLVMMLDGRFPGIARSADVYHFIDGSAQAVRALTERGPFPWWTSPHLKLAFLRPLGGALMLLDRALFGLDPVGWHAHAILWYVLLCAVAAGLYRRVLPPRVALLAACLFAINDTHAMAIAWIANRHSTVSAALVLAGLSAHVRARESGWRPGRALSLAGIALGLAAGETALGGIAYLGAYELVGRKEPLRDRLRALVPAALVVVAYLALYKWLGYGTAASGSYVDPLGQPGAFLRVAPLRALVLYGSFVGAPLPADFEATRPALLPLFVAAALVMTPILVWQARRAAIALGEERRHLAWLAAGALLSLVPSLGGFPGSRLLMMPSVGGVAVLALVLVEVARGRGVAARLGLAALVLVWAVRPAVTLLAEEVMFGAFSREGERISDEAKLPTDPEAIVAVLAASDIEVSFYSDVIFVERHDLRPGRWFVLSGAARDHTVTRVGPDALELAVDGRMLEGPFEVLFRRPESEPLRPGDEVRLDGLTVRVLAVDEGHPTRIRATFARPLDDPRVWLLTWRDGKLRRVSLPPLGEPLKLPFQSGPLER